MAGHDGIVDKRWTGGYTIPAKSTEVFRFWSDFINPTHNPEPSNRTYFNVSIAPESDGKNATTPLIEVKRERSSYFLINGMSDFFGIQPILILTLQNDNNFPVTFLAAHVFILEAA